jgi:hypothetical protein
MTMKKTQYHEPQVALTREQKWDIYIILAFFYFFAGLCTVAVMGAAGVPWLDDNASAWDIIAVSLFWPLFVLKYAVIAIVMLFETLAVRLF